MNKEIRLIIREAEDFPSLPGITLKIFQMASDPDISIQSISKVISSDAAIVARIMKVVNSAFYGFQKKITNIQHAVSILGINAIRNVSLTLSLIDIFPQNQSSQYKDLFRWSLCSGITADLIAAFVGMANRSETFLAALLLNIGQYIFLRYLGDRYTKIQREAEKRGLHLTILEREVMGIDNLEAGMLVAERWNLPEPVLLALKYGENLNKAYEQDFDKPKLNLIETAYLAGLVAEVYNNCNKAVNIETFKFNFSKIFQNDISTAEDILSSIPHLIEDLGSSYDISIGNIPSYEQLLKLSSEELIQSRKKYEQTYFEYRLMRKEVLKKNQKINEINLELLKAKKAVQNMRERSSKVVREEI
jgi:HD-like signal output (HDOD) protein